MARSARLPILTRTYARPRTFDLECPGCGRVHVIARPYVTSRCWEPKASRLICDCRRAWIVGLALWEAGPGPRSRGRPLDQIPTRRTLQELRGVLAGRVERDNQGRIRRSLIILEDAECTCEYLEPPLQHIRRQESVAGCAVHGADSAKGGVDK